MDKKSTLKITEQDFVLTVRKKPSLFNYITYGIIWICILCSVSVPIELIVNGDFMNLPNKELFIIFYVLAICAVIYMSVPLFFGKIVIDRAGREIHIYNPIKHIIPFSEIRNIRVYHENDRQGRAYKYRTELLLGNSILKLQTHSREQAIELSAFLKTYIQLETENEDNEDEL